MNQKAIDYRRLGEVSGKAWRLGHIDGSTADAGVYAASAKRKLNVPKDKVREFNQGFASGVHTVDRNRRA